MKGRGFRLSGLALGVYHLNSGRPESQNRHTQMPALCQGPHRPLFMNTVDRGVNTVRLTSAFVNPPPGAHFPANREGTAKCLEVLRSCVGQGLSLEGQGGGTGSVYTRAPTNMMLSQQQRIPSSSLQDHYYLFYSGYQKQNLNNK